MLAAAPSLNVSAGPNQTVNEGTSVTLTGSFLDPSGDADAHLRLARRRVLRPADRRRNRPHLHVHPGQRRHLHGDFHGHRPQRRLGLGPGGDHVPRRPAGPDRPERLAERLRGREQRRSISERSPSRALARSPTRSSGATARPRPSRPRAPGALSLAHTYATAGTYTISETVSEYDGGSTTASFSINVTQAPARRPRSPRRRPPRSTASRVTFTATVTGPGGPDGHRGVLRRAGHTGRSDRHRHAERGERPGRGDLQHVGAARPAAVRTRSRRSMAAMPTTMGSTSNVVNETITKADAVIVVTPYTVSYDGNPHTATGTATGVETPNPANLSGLLNLSGTTHTNTGSYTDTWTFAGNGNYNSASGTITDLITPPLSVTTIIAISPNPRTTPVSTVDVTFSLPIDTSSPTAGAVTLTDNGNPVAVSGVSFALVPGTTSTYQVGDLSAFTAAGGSYTLTVNAADIDDQYSNAGTGSLSTSWLVSGTTPTITWANPGDHRLRHGAERSPARRHGQRAGDVHLHAGRWHCPGRRQQPDAVGHFSRRPTRPITRRPPQRRRSTSCKRRRRSLGPIRRTSSTARR